MRTQKTLLFLSILIYHAFDTRAQDAIQNKLSPRDYKPSIIELKKFPASPHKLIFVDERDDTTRMGFFWGSNSQYFFKFPAPAIPYLDEKLNNKKGDTPSDTLLLGIRHLWISQVKVPTSILGSFLLSSIRTIGYCRLVCNIYKKNSDRYLFLYAFDNIVSKNGYLGNNKDKLMNENFSVLTEKIDSAVAYSSVPGNIEYAGIKPLKPILAAAKPVDGIYLTFTDFVNNRPAEVGFKYSVSGNLEKIILGESRSDDSVYTEHCWGFCKNNIPYMRVGSRFSKLTRIQNTFELRIAESFQDKYTKEFDAFWLGFDIARDLRSGFPIFAISDIISHKTPPETVMRVSPFKLNIDTGNVY